MLLLLAVLLLSQMWLGRQQSPQQYCDGLQLKASRVDVRSGSPKTFRVEVGNAGTRSVILEKNRLAGTYVTEAFSKSKWQTVKAYWIGRGVASSGATAPPSACNVSCLENQVLLQQNEGFSLIASIEQDAFVSGEGESPKPGRYRITFQYEAPMDTGSCRLHAQPVEFVIGKANPAR
jgi:hypothetical protein